MTKFEMLKEMAELQAKYDEEVYKAHNCEFDKDKCYCALVDEVGELNHELKANWCWWKKTQKPIDNDKVLEELADVWHFALSLYNHNENYYYKLKYCIGHIDLGKEYTSIIMRIMHNTCSLIIHMIELSYCLGITFEQTYEAYKKKNKINYERLQNGY